MENEFVPYEQALALKELGFDEPCFGYYFNESKVLMVISEKDINYLTGTSGTSNTTFTSAPTYSQAFRWFREKYRLHQYIKQHCGERFYFYIEDMVHPRRFDEYTVEMLRSFNESTSQEEAELKCLLELINICKKK